MLVRISTQLDEATRELHAYVRGHHLDREDRSMVQTSSTDMRNG